MITSTGPKMLEYHARPGDPETQPLIPLIHDDCDLDDLLMACV